MKRIVTLALSLLATMSMAFAFNAEMVVQSNNGRFLLQINGRTVNRTPQTQVIVPNIDGGNHHISMRMVDGRPNTLQFRGVFVPRNERSIFTLVRQGRGMMTLQKTASEPLRNYSPRPRQAGPRGNGYGQGPNRPYNDNLCYDAMHPADFQNALRAVHNSRGFEKQFRTAKEVVRTTCLSSRQLAKLVKALDYEEHMLSVAKLGWDRVVDPENFQVVENQIRRRAHLRSLQDYVDHHPRFEPQYSQGANCSPNDGGPYYEDDHYDYGYYNGGGYNNAPRSISNDQFRLLLRDMRQSSYDKDKLQIGKRIAEQNPLTSEQVRQLCNQLDYDAYKLKLAKHAYRHVVDPENYFIVKEVFSFTSYKRQLEDFIR